MPVHSHPRPKRYHRAFQSATNPHLIEFDDGAKYVVKFKGNPQGNHVLISEYVVSELIHLLQFAGRRGRLVAVDAYFISTEPNLQGRNLEAGLQFGLPLLEDYENFSDANIPNLKNRGALPQVIVLDTFTVNTDRHSGNLLLLFEDETRQNKSCEFVLIDHSHVFGGPQWNEHTLRQLANNNELRASLINFNNVQPRLEVFEPFLVKLEALSPEQIEAIINGVPTEWGFPSAERGALLDFLVTRKDIVRDIINRVINP